jgi:MFS family permease
VSRAVALRRRVPLFALLTANLLSVTGTTLTTVAVPWFVLETTGSAARTGVTAAVSLAPVVISAGLGGALVDRIGFRRASVIADVVSAVLVAAIPLLWLTVGLPFGVLLALLFPRPSPATTPIAALRATAFPRGLFATPGETSREALVPEIAAQAGTTLERGMSALDGVSRGGKMVGAPLAGVLIAVFGAADLLFADALTFTASALLVGVLVRVVAEPRHGTATTARTSPACARAWPTSGATTCCARCACSSSSPTCSTRHTARSCCPSTPATSCTARWRSA